jgi:type II secretion system protein D
MNTAKPVAFAVVMLASVATARGQAPAIAARPVRAPIDRPTSAAPRHPQVAPAPDQPQPLTTQSWQLRHVTWKEFENRLSEIWGPRLTGSLDSIGDIATFRFPPAPAGATSVVVDHRTSLVTIAAPPSAAASWQRLMSVLDSRPRTTGERTSVVPLTKADPSAVQKAVSLIQQVLSAANPRRKQHIGQFVSLLFQAGAAGGQPEAGAQPGNQPPPPEPGVQPPDTLQVGEAPPGGAAEAIARLVGNVQIEILDDVVIVRGRGEDVEKVMQIIEQIEQQSIQFRPEVEVYFLKHVNSQALNDMIATVASVVFARQGPVTIVPLVRPNALMLIGRKENIPAVIELIQKLDQPMAPGSELRVFQLKHMSAIDMERVVRQFFVDRPGVNTNLRTGLDTRVLVIAEYRANALVVQASPRDMLELVRLIESLDVESSPTNNEVRVFKLRNSIAETLAPVLQEAITGQGAAVTAQQQQAALGAAGGGAGATSPARATPPALNLQFLQLGPGGQRLIQSGILSNMRITADPGGNALVVVGPASAMELMEALIRQLDGLPATDAVVKVFTLTNGDATALATMLQTLFGQTAQQGGQAGQAALAQITAGGESTLVPLRFSVDTRTNSIIASGNAGDLEVIYNILTRLDEGDIRQRTTTVYRLRNAPAADVATALTDLLTQQTQLLQAAPELVSTLEQVERQIIVVPEVVTNSLIVSASPRYLPEVQRIINDLDRRPPMVVIQVVIAEVTLTDNEQFGVEWGLQDSLMFDRSASGTGGRFAFNNAILPNDATPASLATRESVAGQALSNLALGRTDPTLGFGGLVLTASNESINVLIRALEQSSRAQVISRPQVQTLDNQLAFVQVGSLVGRIQGSTITQFGVQNTVVDTQVGIIMQVQPRTSPDGTIVMIVQATKSAVGPESTGTPVSVDQNGNVIRQPQILLTTAQTTVSARSGQTVILGGLITKDQQENSNRNPFLADIPVLGRLFRFDSVSNQRTELLIIMTPFIVETDEQIEWMNLRETERMSWCLADVVNIHGPIPAGGASVFGDQSTPLIFPDLQPGAPMPVVPATPTPAVPASPMPVPAAPAPMLPPPAPPVPALPIPYSPTPPPPAPTLVPQSIQPVAPPAGTPPGRPEGPN